MSNKDNNDQDIEKKDIENSEIEENVEQKDIEQNEVENDDVEQKEVKSDEQSNSISASEQEEVENNLGMNDKVEVESDSANASEAVDSEAVTKIEKNESVESQDSKSESGSKAPVFIGVAAILLVGLISIFALNQSSDEEALSDEEATSTEEMLTDGMEEGTDLAQSAALPEGESEIADTGLVSGENSQEGQQKDLESNMSDLKTNEASSESVAQPAKELPSETKMAVKDAKASENTSAAVVAANKGQSQELVAEPADFSNPSAKQEQEKVVEVIPEPMDPANFPRATEEYVVQFGDTLSSIAEKQFGDSSRWMEIYSQNSAIIKNPNKIRLGLKLMISPSNRSQVKSQDTQLPPENAESGTEDVKKEEVKKEDVKKEDVKKEEVKKEDVKKEEVKKEEVKKEEVKKEEIKKEEIK